MTAASSCLARSAAATSARLSAADSPANCSGCATTGADGGGGRSSQAASTGLRSTATIVSPASWNRASPSWLISQGS